MCSTLLRTWELEPDSQLDHDESNVEATPASVDIRLSNRVSQRSLEASIPGCAPQRGQK